MFNKGDRLFLTFEKSNSTFYGFFDRYLETPTEYGDCIVKLDGGLGDEVEVFENQIRIHRGRDELPTLEETLSIIDRLASMYDDGMYERSIEIEVKHLIEYRDVLKLLESAETERDMWKQKYEDLRKDIAL